MYTSVQQRSTQTFQQKTPLKEVAERWKINLPYVAFKQQPVGDDHEDCVISMREHVMPVVSKHKEEATTVIKQILRNKAWESIVKCIKEVHESKQARYAGSVGLYEEAKQIADRLKVTGFNKVVMLVGARHNVNQINSLRFALEKEGLVVQTEVNSSDVFSNHSLIIAQSQYIKDLFGMSYHLDGPKSVPDVEGNDAVLAAKFKPAVNHSEAVAVISWKNYNSFGIH